VTASLDDYDVTTGTKELMRFLVDDVSNWYVRINRHRFWVEGTPDPAPLATLHTVLTTVARLLAPTAPFMTDWMHRQLAGTSVHLAGFPIPASKTGMKPCTCHGCGAPARFDCPGRCGSGKMCGSRCASRSARAKSRVPAQVRGPLFDELLGLFKTEVNVKQVESWSRTPTSCGCRPKANFRSSASATGRTPEGGAGGSRAFARPAPCPGGGAGSRTGVRRG
jgi:isoleucyl-tRNA synthetase